MVVYIPFENLIKCVNDGGSAICAKYVKQKPECLKIRSIYLTRCNPKIHNFRRILSCGRLKGEFSDRAEITCGPEKMLDYKI